MIQQNRLSDKFILLFCSMFLIFIIACSTMSQSTVPAVPTFDPNSLGTIIVQTANAATTQTALHVTLTFTPTPTYIRTPKVTQLVSPFPSVVTGPTITFIPDYIEVEGYKAGAPTATPMGSDITDPDFRAGVAAHAAKNYEQTVILMSSAIASNPNLAPPYRYRGISYWYLGRCSESLADFEKALSINPDYAAAWFGRGLAKECLGDEEQMLLDYQKALSIDPSLSIAHYNLGVYYYDHGNYQKALEEYTISAYIDPKRAGAWAGRAQAFFRLGRYLDCISNASKAIETNPEEWNAYSNRALCAAFMDDFAAAVEDYKIFVSHDDTNAEIWYNLGISQRETGDIKGALASYNKALELDPSYYPAYINRGNVYLALEEFNNAMTDFNSALEFRDTPLAYQGRGVAHHGLKEYDKAIDDYEKALKLVPSDTHLYCYISLSYLEDHKYQDSIEAAQKSNQTDQGCNSQVLNEVLARSYYALGNYDQALLHINEALKGKDYTLGHYYRGIIYQAVGKNQEAIQELELFLAYLGTSELAKDEEADARERLAQLKQ